MRILQMLPALQSGGVETGTIDIAKALKKLGHEVFVMSNGGPLVKELVRAGIPHVTYPIHAKSLFTLFLVKTVEDFIRRERIDIVHARSRVPAWVGYFAARRADVPFITTCHGYYSTHLLSRVMGWGKEVIVISKIIGRHMIDDFNVPCERIHLIYRGVDLSRYPFHPTKYDLSAKKKTFVVANIGRLTPIKGHQHFIKAIHLASQNIPGLEGWIVGDPEKGKEKYLEELKGLVAKLGLEYQVKFLGRREDIPEILQKADLLALTTNVPEAFGRVLIEAGASGTAVVATRVGGILEIVEHQKSGLLVGVDDEQELAKSFMFAHQHPEVMAQYSRTLREKVEKEFSLDLMVKKTLAIYEKTKQKKRILITKLGSLGDLILAVPSFRMIKKRYPQASLALVVDSRWYGVMKLCPYLDEIWTFDRGKKKGRWQRLLRLAKRLRREQFDVSLDLQNNRQTHLLAFLSNIPKRIGYARGIFGFLLSKGVAWGKKALPPVEHQFKLLNQLGVTEFNDSLELWVKPEDRKVIESSLEDAWVNENDKLIGFSLSASERWKTKNWPVEHFIRLAKELANRMNVRIFLLGDHHAQPLAEAFAKENLPYVINLVNKTSVQELIALISKLDVLVTGDSAPMHMAAALGTKLVALFGPTDPQKHLPPGKKHVFFKKKLPCSPCYSDKCKAKEFLCMPGIQVEDVLNAVKDLVSQEKAAVPVP